MTAARARTRRQRWKRRSQRLQQLLRICSVLLTGLAVTQELRKPAERRRWHGIVAGYVPYDLRFRGSRARYRERMWAPEDSRLLQPQAFGVGWTLNVGRVLRLLRLR